MFKKIMSVFAIATMMIATSCSNDEFDSPQSGDEATVSFTAQLPSGLQSKSRAYRKALGDGTTATTLSYAVYEVSNNGGWNLLSGLGGEQTINMATTVSLRLVNGNEYAVVFWADAENSIYTFDAAGMKVVANYTNALSNDEKLDAFYAVEKFKVTGSSLNKTVYLKRPFAQLNIGTADLAAASAAGHAVAKAGITVKTYNTLNFENGSVEGEAEVNFGLADFSGLGQFPVDGGYEYLTMNYLLMPADKKADNAITISYDNAQDRTFQNVPLQRNYRTNIYGNLLTSQSDFNVEIKPDFDTPDYNIPELNPQELLDAAENGGSVTLSGDVVVNRPIEVKANMTLNLNGYTLTYNTPAATGPQHLFTVDGGATLTLDGGKIIVNDLNNVRFTSNGGCYVANALQNGNIIVNGGSYTVQDCTVFQADGGTVNINDGTFDITETSWGYKYMLNNKDYSGGTIVVKGGKFHSFDPANNEADGNGTNYVADGYTSVKNAGWYYVMLSTAGTRATSNVELNNAINSGKTTIFLSEGTFTPSTIKSGITFIGVGDATVLDFTDKDYGVGGSVAIENAKIVYASNSTYRGLQHTTSEKYTNVTFEGQPFLYGENVKFDNCKFNTSDSENYNVWTYGAKNVTFNGCTFKCAGKSVLIYTENSTGTEAVFNNCILEATQPVVGKAAIEIGKMGDDNCTVYNHVVRINNTTATGFGNGNVSGNSLWNNKNGALCEVYVNGSLVHQTI